MRRLSILPCLLAGAVLCACPSRVSQGPGIQQPGQEPERPRVEPKKDDSADRALAQAREAAVAAPNHERAAEAYLSVSKAYPETTAGQEALYQAGVLYYESKDFAHARRAFNQLLFENPLFDKAPDAKLKLAMSALEVGAYRDAYQTLASLAERAQGEERRRLLEAAARAAEGAGLFGDALNIELKRVQDAQSAEEQKLLLDRITDLIEGKAAFIDIARAVQDLPPTHPAWPILTFKLARIYYHLRDWNHLEETLKRFLEVAPSHPFAQQAQELLARANRRIEVNAKRVGVVLPMSGKYQPLGELVMRGLKLALDGSDVELVVKDTQGDVTATGKAVEDLAFEDGAIAVLGPLLGDDSRRAALMAEELQIPIMTLTRSEGITSIGPHVFRNMLTNSAQAEALVDYGVDVLGYKNWALLYPNVTYGTELANDFWDKLLEHGGAVRAAESYSYDQTTFTAEVKKLVGRQYLEDRADYLAEVHDLTETDPFRRRKAVEKIRKTLEPIVDFDAIFIPDDWKKVSLVTPALAVEDIITNACDTRDLEKIKKTTGKKDLKTVTLFGANLWNSPKNPRTGVPELVERGGKFVLCSIYVDGFFADSNRPATRRFVKAFHDKYPDQGSRDPGLLEAIGYDVGMMFRQVVDQQRPATREQFREALAGIKNLEGATGTTTIDDKREARKQLFLLTIDQKGVHEITPPAKAAAASGS